MKLILCYTGLFWCLNDVPVRTYAEHAIYLSTIEMKIESQVLHLTVKVFEDDLRDVLRDYHGHIPDTASVLFMNEVNAYFQSHIDIKGDNNTVQFQATGIHRVGDSYQVTLIGHWEKVPVQLRVQATYFFELFPTQQNVLHLQMDGQRKYYIFKKGKSAFVTGLQ